MTVATTAACPEAEADQEPPPPPPPPVADGGTFDDTLSLTSDDDVDAFNARGFTNITGDVVIGADVQNCVLEHVQSIRGRIRADQATQLTTLAFPRLAITGGLEAIDTPALETLAFPALIFVNGDALFRRTSAEDLSGLTDVIRIEGDLIVEENLELIALNRLGKVESVEGRFIVRDNPKLEDVAIGPVAAVGGDLVVEDNDALQSSEGLEGLETVGGDLVVSDNDALNSADGLSSVAAVGGDLVISDNDSLEDLDGAGGVEVVGGDLTVSDNNALTDVDALRDVESVGGELRLDGNQGVEDAGAIAILQALVDAGVVPSGQASVNGVVIFAQTRFDRLAVFSPSPGERFLRGADAILSIDVVVNIGNPSVQWSATLVDSNDAPIGVAIDLGTGQVLRVNTELLPIGRVRLEAVVTANGLVERRGVSVFIDDLVFAPEIEPISIRVGALAPTTEVTDGTLVVRVTERQPAALDATVLHPRDGDLSFLTQWSVDGVPLVSGAIFDLAQLAARVEPYQVTATITDRRGAEQSVPITVVVAPLVFTVDVIAPVLTGVPEGNDSLAPPYFDVVPIVLSLRHPWMQAFGATSVRVLDERGLLIANASGVASGPGVFRAQASTNVLDPGPHLLRVEVVDANGAVATAVASVDVLRVLFSAQLTSPFEGQVLQEGDPLAASASISHSLVDEGLLQRDVLRTRYFSSRSGLLRDAAGADVFAADATPSLVLPITGSQTITAEVNDSNGRVARSTRTIIVRSSNLSATLQSPAANTVLLPGTPVRLSTLVTKDVGVDALITWRIDGVELAANVAGYGTDPTNPARTDLNLGAFTFGAGIFNIPAFSEGTHTVELFVRVPEEDGPCHDPPSRPPASGDPGGR